MTDKPGRLERAAKAVAAVTVVAWGGSPGNVPQQPVRDVPAVRATGHPTATAPSKAARPAPPGVTDMIEEMLQDAGHAVQDLGEASGDVKRAFERAVAEARVRGERGRPAPRYGESRVAQPHADPSLEHGVPAMRPEAHRKR